MKTVLTVCFTVLALAAVSAFVVETRDAAIVTLAAALVATALHHGVDRLERLRLSHGWALAITIVAFFGVLGGLVMIVAPPAVSQATALISEAPLFIARIEHSAVYETLVSKFRVDQLAPTGTIHTLEEGVAPALAALGSLLRFGLELITALFLVVFMVIFGGRLINALLAEALPDRRLRYQAIARKIYESVGGYVSGLGLICTVNATLTTTFLAIAHVPFFLTLGILSGFSSLIPYGGPLIAGVTVTLIALLSKSLWTAAATAIYFACYGQLEGQVLSPLVFRRTVHVSPLITFLAIFFFAEIAGIMGAIVAVPLAAALQIVLKEVLALRRERLHIS